MHLTVSDNLSQTTAAVLGLVCARIENALPGAEVHHVGATAVPGSLTKGDLDVVVRVDRSAFPPAIEKLRAAFDIKQPENWDSHFASFGSDKDYAMPVGVQLVIKDSEADFFLFVRDYLSSHPEVLSRYNDAKRESFCTSSEEYWTAKNSVLSEIIALIPKSANSERSAAP